MMTIRSILTFISLIFSVQLVQPMSWPSMTYERARAATLAGCAFGAGFIGYKYLSSRPSADQRADEDLKEDLERKISKGPAQHVAKMALKQFELLAYEDREKLLPAVIWVNAPALLSNLLLVAHASCRANFEAYQKSLTDAEQKVLRSEDPIALRACIISRHPGDPNQFDDINCLAKQTPENLFIKNETNPRVFLGRPLRAGECAIIGYSDGDIQIHLHNSDRRLLNDLSHEQREFIKTLAQGNLQEERHLNSRETSIFHHLKPEIQKSLTKNYTIKTPTQRFTRNTEVGLWWGLQALDVARYGQLLYNGNYFKCGCRLFLMGIFHLSLARLARHQRDPLAFATILGLSEATLNGNFIMNKLGSMIFKEKAPQA